MPESLAAAREHRYPQGAAGKLAGDRDTGRAGADDAQIRLDGAAVDELIGLDQGHPGPRRSSGRPRIVGGMTAPSRASAVGARSRISPSTPPAGVRPAPRAT